MSGFTVGLDIGQSQDHTALTAVEEVSEDPRRYHLRHVRRFELGTPYPEIAEEVVALMGRDALQVVNEKKVRSGRYGVEREREEVSPTLVVDATGVGRPVVDMLRDEGLSPVSIWITGGDSISKDGREYRVPKRELASTVQALLQAGRLKFAQRLPLRDVLTDELQKFRAKINIDTGEASFEHWRERDTDDVVLALACALWHAASAPKRSGGGANVPL
jgi:hypothetical protein